ncbi:MAG: sterol desaturase family protein, partial [Gammaproteobacteria bacterium]|nr:sterol desaturase family protein [Gammaproteobacteria bacterium]
LFAMNTGLSMAVVLPLTAAAAAYAPAWRPAVVPWWDGWAGLALDLLLLDFLIYWWHRANHEVPFLWRFHEVHHL